MEDTMPESETPPKKIVIVTFWRSASGTEPVLDWLMSLSKEQRKTIGEDLKTVEFGWPVGMPLVRSLGKGLWEVRISLRECIARIIFKMVGHNMVLLHGFIKKTQKTSAHDLELALRRAKSLEETNETKT
jgi:phage-related protein